MQHQPAAPSQARSPHDTPSCRARRSSAMAPPLTVARSPCNRGLLRGRCNVVALLLEMRRVLLFPRQSCEPEANVLRHHLSSPLLLPSPLWRAEQRHPQRSSAWCLLHLWKLDTTCGSQRLNLRSVEQGVSRPPRPGKPGSALPLFFWKREQLRERNTRGATTRA